MLEPVSKENVLSSDTMSSMPLRPPFSTEKLISFREIILKVLHFDSCDAIILISLSYDHCRQRISLWGKSASGGLRCHCTSMKMFHSV